MQVSGFNIHRLWAGFILVLAIALTGCVDQDFDAPPPGGSDPDLTPNISIADLKAMHMLGEYEEITEDLIIEALVISSDEAGNFFRQLVIQDETGGIEIRVDATELHAVYPVGRRVFVRLNGLWLGDFNNLVQLGAAVVEDEDGFLELARIPESVLDQYIVTGTFGNEVIPAVKTIDALTSADVSTLVTLEDVQFVDGDAGSTYADAQNLTAFNLDIEDCDKNQLIVRSSGFSSFASEITPLGNGRITGVLGVFGSDLQLLIRDTDDVSMDGERCQLGGGNRIDISAVRQAFAGGAGTAPEGFIQGVVISDRTSGNHVGQNMFVQDGSAGVVVRFSETHSYNLGDEIQVEVTGQTLEEFNGLLQVNGVPLSNAQVIGAGALPSPRITTVSEIQANLEAWESTRVMLQGATLSGNSTFSGTLTVTDATGSMIMFTRSQASFASDAVPAEPVDITAILSEFGEPQLVINTRADVGGGTGGGDDLNESFNSLPDDADVDLAGWTNVAVKGTRLWRVQVFSGNHYAQATAFNDTEPEMETWLVTPALDGTAAKVLTFNTAKAFWDHNGLTVLSSTDFTGDVTTATWNPVNTRIANMSDPDHEWIASDEIDLEAFGAPVYIAFRYEGSGPSEFDTSYRVDDIVVRDK
ncbi:MAG: DUF5689 domain-containing protein [Saprospiraceae bacterium]|nr:DUF5689 domain-containing protein [Saprospiraceae bacterium]